ncbi:uncharacterized protein PAN0_004c2395 [Moesziomyces antarcticus]|uniref:Uncharacterized protein n=1 Tax=Pseudozyma antarctica TaxID=84753 RepID=A0A081CBY9_PSEA2|nr:uncharacterized protein PAN0_004c2395 [Moesziomyces antarcticus]GAK64185.1 hypothetical protein PAN0_004c2395 [Moesziomyces antarcticus]
MSAAASEAGWSTIGAPTGFAACWSVPRIRRSASCAADRWICAEAAYPESGNPYAAYTRPPIRSMVFTLPLCLSIRQMGASLVWGPNMGSRIGAARGLQGARAPNLARLSTLHDLQDGSGEDFAGDETGILASSRSDLYATRAIQCGD